MTNGAMTNEAMTDEAMTNGTMTNGAMTNGKMTDGAMTDDQWWQVGSLAIGKSVAISCRLLSCLFVAPFRRFSIDHSHLLFAIHRRFQNLAFKAARSKLAR